jgi:hypothetical protein
MRNILSISLLFICSIASAKNYYISNTGNDGNSGLTSGSPWLTIGKASSFTGFAAGDSILFERGGTFIGSLIITKSGSTGKPIVIAAYGTGAKPLISGLTTLSGWTNVATNIWECSAPTLKSTVNILTFDGVAHDLGRTPNENAPWSVYQSATTTAITSSAITGTITPGTEIVIKKNSFTIARSTVSSQAGTTLNYVPVNAIDNNNPLLATVGKPNFGFFIQRDSTTLDQQGEWYNSPTRKKMRLYSTVNPSTFTIKASFVDTLINLGKQGFITVANLSFEGAGMYAVESNLGTNVTVQNCDFNNNTRAVYVWNTDVTTVTGNTINNSFNNAILVCNRQRKGITISNNYVANTGKLVGIGTFPSNYNLKAVVATTDTTRLGNYIDVTGNTVLHTGYMGIEFQGANVTVKHNFVNYYDSTLDDGGGIYTFNNIPATNLHWYNRKVISNIVGNAIGAWMGTDRATARTPDVAGLYYDEQAENIVTDSNTVFNIPGNGIQMNAPLNMSIYHNTFYNCDWAILLAKKAVREISGIAIKYNTLYQKTATQLSFFHINADLTKPTTMTIAQSLTNLWDMDSNYITNQKTAGYHYFYYADGVNPTFPADFNLATWRTTYGHDVHSTLPPVTVTGTNTQIVVNPSDTVLNFPFYGFRKTTPDNSSYDHSVNLARGYTSMILIDNGSVTNIAPTADAGSAQVITLPTSSTNVTGAASTDIDGTISSYAWVKISGPTGGTITSPSVVSTSITALQQGTYVFRLTVTDNLGATGQAFVQITVNAANIPPTANAGNDTTITLPANTATLAGSATDVDGTLSAYLWTKISGPTGGTITSPTFLTTGITALQQGTYVYQLTVTDNSGATGTDFVQIVVNPAIPPANIPPTANAGADQTQTLPTSTATLTGSGADPDGTIASYLWRKISGPTGGAITSPTIATTGITGLTAGTYIYQLRVTDNSGDTAIDAMQLTVNAANIIPTANAGADQVITLPTNTVTLTGSGSDADGTISGYLWTKISGPSGGSITSSTSASTGITGLLQGVYIYQLRVTDNAGDTATDAVQITVNPLQVNTVPIPNAGNDTTITLPGSSITLVGSGTPTTAGATITGYSWAIILNSGSATLGSATSATTTLDNLTPGLYTIELTITDSNGLTAKDAVNVTVNAAPVAARATIFFHVKIR